MTSYPFDEQAARAFLQARYGDLEPGERIELRTIDQRVKPNKVRQYWGNIEEVLNHARGVGEGIENHVGVNPRLGSGGSKVDVSRVGWLWAELDRKYGDVLPAIGAFEFQPTILVESSTGNYHAYWSICPLDAQSEGWRVERLLKRLYRHLGGADSVQDISRVLRLPGTWNFKKEYPEPFQVRVVSHDPSAVYTIEQFEALLPAPPEEVRQPKSHAGELFLLPLPDHVAHLLSYIPAQQDYRLWIKALASVHAIYPDETGVGLCEAWSPGQPGEIEAKFRSFRREPGRADAAGVGSLIHMAQEHGYVQPPPPVPTMIKRQPPEAPWRETLKELGEIDRDDLPYHVEVLANHCGPTVDVLPLDYTVAMVLSFASVHLRGMRFENLGPQFWTLGVFHTSSGKNIITDGLNDIFEALPVDPTNPLTFYTTGTPEGIWNKLNGEDKRVMAYLSEFGSYVASFSRDHMAGARDAWCNLYDGRTVAHILARSSTIARRPVVSVAASCTPDHIRAHVKPLDLNGGYLNRFHVVAGDDISPDNEVFPDNRKVSRLALNLHNHLIGFNGVTEARWDTETPYWTGKDPTPYAELKQRLGIGSGKVRRLEDEDTTVGAPGRVAARAKKIGMILEALEAAPQVVAGVLMVRHKNIALACQLALRANAMFEGMAGMVNQGADEKLLGKLRRVLARCPGKQASRTYLQRQTGADIANLTRCLMFMQEEGEILPAEGSRGTTIEYRMVG